MAKNHEIMARMIERRAAELLMRFRLRSLQNDLRGGYPMTILTDALGGTKSEISSARQKQTTSGTSEMLTPSEVEWLLRKGKESLTFTPNVSRRRRHRTKSGRGPWADGLRRLPNG